MKTGNFTEILDWDSQFFGLRIAKIVLENWDGNYIEERLQEYKSLSFDLVYIFLSGGMTLPERLCSLYHCKQVDRKMVYRSDMEGNYEVSPFITEYQGEASELYELALQSGVDSRYRLDKCFAPGDFEKLYKTWIDNSVAGLIADKVFVFQEQQCIKGFVTVKLLKNEASIGLIATDTLQRGRGIGSHLLHAVKQYARDCHITSLSVATQEQNSPARAFYEKNGFTLESKTNIYHAWLKDN